MERLGRNDPRVPAAAAHEPSYSCFGVLPDGRVCCIHRLISHWTLLIGLDETGYSDRYCYHFYAHALYAMREWDGSGDPVGWHRHPKSGRRRDIDTGREWIAP